MTEYPERDMLDYGFELIKEFVESEKEEATMSKAKMTEAATRMLAGLLHG